MMELLSLLLLCGLCLGIYRRWRASPLATYYWPGLLLKVLAGWGLIALYRYYYGYGDIISYHKQATELVRLFWNQPSAYLQELSKIGFMTGAGGYQGSDRVDFFIRIISPFYILADANIWIASAFLSVLSFFGLFWLAGRLARFYQGSDLAAAVAFLLWPSLLFFTGSLTKEALVTPAIAVLVGAFLPLMQGEGRSKLFHWLLALVAAWIIWRIKYYFALPLFALLLALVLAQFAKKRGVPQLRLFLLLGAVLLIAGFLLAQLHPNLNPEHVLGVLTENYWEKALIGEGNKRLHFDELQPTVWSVLLYTPKALAGGLLMPLPLLPMRLEVLPLIAGAENLMLLLLLIGAFYKLYRLPYQRIPLPALGLALYVCVLAVAMAIASPNLGTLMRYRTAYLPFALFLLLYWLFPTGRSPKQ